MRVISALRLSALTCSVGLCACVTRPPSIAHVHIGHAVTAVHVTPGHEGYLSVAEIRANEARQAADRANVDTDLTQLKAHIAATVAASDSLDDFGVKQSVTMAANHIAFAATSADASANVVRFAPKFTADIASVVGRCDYIVLLGKDVAASTSLREAAVLADEIDKLARANVEGDSSTAASPRDAGAPNDGVLQLRADVQAMIAREMPPYRTVDQWYLFNLVRLPNGRWIFDKLGRGGTIDGYK